MRPGRYAGISSNGRATLIYVVTRMCNLAGLRSVLAVSKPTRLILSDCRDGGDCSLQSRLRVSSVSYYRANLHIDEL
jgi:hypothetical protein